MPSAGKLLVAAVGATLLLDATTPAQSARSQTLGRVATSHGIRAYDISVAPDGVGLPQGHGTAADGAVLYAARCAPCHGARGEAPDEDYPKLAGGFGTLTSNAPVLTVGSYWPYATTVWDYIRRAMPYDAPGTLPADDVYAVTAYVLYLNEIVRETDILDRSSLPKVRMPNRDGFVTDPRPDVPQSPR
ncbi:MAG TPA: cytochrome c [Polyangiaceae bacterium]|nr:cytochrome c [Polyangiaceae bacterium]